jgi:hypothetical protein
LASHKSDISLPPTHFHPFLDCNLGAQSNERLSLLGGYKSFEFPVFIKLAECFNADGLVDAANADGREATRCYQFCNRPTGIRIIRCLEKNGQLRLTVCRRLQRLNTHAAEGFNEFSSCGKKPGNDLTR